MYNVSEIENMALPEEGINCSVRGKFYYRISGDDRKKSNYIYCYVADSSDNDTPKLFLSDEIGEAIIDKDETFGMMVGGEFAYYDIDIELECIIKKTSRGLVCEAVEALKLEKNTNSQQFRFVD